MFDNRYKFTKQTLALLIDRCGRDLRENADQFATGGDGATECTIYIRLRTDELPSMSVTLERDGLVPSYAAEHFGDAVFNAYGEAKGDGAKPVHHENEAL